MKRIGNVYSKIYDKENIRTAIEKASIGKKDRKEVKEVLENIDTAVEEIHILLKEKKYKSSKYKFSKIIDKGKEREIAKLPFFPDRIIHWALMLQIEEYLIKTFVSTTYAAIPERGQSLALKKLQRDIRENPYLEYCLKIDVKKFFPNVDKEILKELFRRKFKDNDLLWLLDEIVDGYPKNGIPIGNYTSQYFGNFYLSYVDHYIKERVKIKSFHRYMDDMVFLAETKEELWTLLNSLRTIYEERLNLEIKDNYQIFPTDIRGVDFVGYRVYKDKTILRNKTKNRMIRKTNKIRKKKYVSESEIGTVSAYNGILKHVTGKRLHKNHLSPVKELINDAKYRKNAVDY